MTKKVIKVLLLGGVCAGCIVGIVLFELYQLPIGCSLLSIAFGVLSPCFAKRIQDLADNSNWKISQRKLQRGNLIDGNTDIRISFSYLYRIKIDGIYLLVKNARGTGKYQPVGGVYRFSDEERTELANLFHIMDDNKMPVDSSSRNDYRLRIKNKYLRSFMKRFDDEAKRERISNVGREFKEELVDKGLVNWSCIQYRYCGRHITNLEFEEHFQIYQIMLFDIVELIPDEEQKNDLRKLLQRGSNDYLYFVNEKEIQSLGIDTDNNKLEETIGDQTKFTLEREEDSLSHEPKSGDTFSVKL